MRLATGSSQAEKSLIIPNPNIIIILLVWCITRDGGRVSFWGDGNPIVGGGQPGRPDICTQYKYEGRGSAQEQSNKSRRRLWESLIWLEWDHLGQADARAAFVLDCSEWRRSDPIRTDYHSLEHKGEGRGRTYSFQLAFRSASWTVRISSGMIMPCGCEWPSVCACVCGARWRVQDYGRGGGGGREGE
jgi:hypothetical protein